MSLNVLNVVAPVQVQPAQTSSNPSVQSDDFAPHLQSSQNATGATPSGSSTNQPSTASSPNGSKGATPAGQPLIAVPQKIIPPGEPSQPGLSLVIPLMGSPPTSSTSKKEATKLEPNALSKTPDLQNQIKLNPQLLTFAVLPILPKAEVSSNSQVSLPNASSLAASVVGSSLAAETQLVAGLTKAPSATPTGGIENVKSLAVVVAPTPLIIAPSVKDGKAPAFNQWPSPLPLRMADSTQASIQNQAEDLLSTANSQKALQDGSAITTMLTTSANQISASLLKSNLADPTHLPSNLLADISKITNVSKSPLPVQEAILSGNASVAKLASLSVQSSGSIIDKQPALKSNSVDGSVQSNSQTKGIMSISRTSESSPNQNQGGASSQSNDNPQSLLSSSKTDAVSNISDSTIATGQVVNLAAPRSQSISISSNTAPVVSSQNRALVIQQVTDRMQLLAVTNNKQAVVVHLNPKDLGSITMTVQTLGKSIEATLNVSHDGVRAMLANDKSALTETMQRKGYLLADFKVVDQAASSGTNNSSRNSDRSWTSQQFMNNSSQKGSQQRNSPQSSSNTLTDNTPLTDPKFSSSPSSIRLNSSTVLDLEI